MMIDMGGRTAAHIDIEVKMKHYIIPIFIPHYGCPHQCIFCNQQKITGMATPVTPGEVSAIIRYHLGRITEERHIEVAYYGGSFTALPESIQYGLLRPACQALGDGRIHGIRLSTRPDCVNAAIVEKLKKCGVSTIELGAQALDDDILRLSLRGHTSQDIKLAAKMIKEAGLCCGLQLMVGLPGDNWAKLARTAYEAVQIQPDFARIYPTLVIEGTGLARLYRQHRYRPLDLEAAVSQASFLKIILERAGIVVIRVGLQASEELSSIANVLAGPYHPAFGEMVDASIFRLMVTRWLECIRPSKQTVTIHHHVRDSSKLRGIANANILYWRKLYESADFKFVPDEKKLGNLAIDYCNCRYLVNKQMLLV
jgi:histone acetyltransferase (RNA polymerase elongator complex component)